MELNPHILEEEINKRMEEALLGSKSRKCCMKQWQDVGCYFTFMGEESFDVPRLEKIMDVRENK